MMHQHNQKDLEYIKTVIRDCLDKLYEIDYSLFKRNKKTGLCERCLVFRFAHYLQNQFQDYFVDCDYNSSLAGIIDEQGRFNGNERHGKIIRNEDGTETKRFVDIIVHKRTTPPDSDFICFEIKKWNNRKARETKKDINNLKILTADYGYKFGFYLIFGRTKETTSWTIFEQGQPIEENVKVFRNEAN